MKTQLINLSEPKRMVINYSKTKSKIIEAGKTIKGSSYFKAIYKDNYITQKAEMFLKKSNGDERFVLFENIKGNPKCKKIQVEECKNNQITSKTSIILINDNGTRKIIPKEKFNFQTYHSIKGQIYSTHKNFIDSIIQNVKSIPEETHPKGFFKTIKTTLKNIAKSFIG